MPLSKDSETDTVPVWAAKLISDLNSLKVSMEAVKLSSEENNRTLRGFNGTPGLISRLEGLSFAVEEVKTRLDDLSEKVCAEAEDSKEDFKYLSWQWVVERLGTPIAVAAIGFFLFTLCPALIIVATLLPDILQHFITAPVP